MSINIIGKLLFSRKITQKKIAIKNQQKTHFHPISKMHYMPTYLWTNPCTNFRRSYGPRISDIIFKKKELKPNVTLD